MSNTFKHSWISTLIATVASSFLPHVAFASVGAGAGLPYEDVFSKIVTSVTGPWAWAVAILCVLMFVWRAVERGGDLGGATLGFLGPAFICTLLLGAKKVMGFFGQGAMFITSSASWESFATGVLAGLLLFGPLFTLPLYRRHQCLLHESKESLDAAQQPQLATQEHALEI